MQLSDVDINNPICVSGTDIIPVEGMILCYNRNLKDKNWIPFVIEKINSSEDAEEICFFQTKTGFKTLVWKTEWNARDYNIYYIPPSEKSIELKSKKKTRLKFI